VSVVALLIGGIAFVVALLAVPVTTRLARRVGAVTTPRADRWSRQAVPFLGGLAVAAAVGVVAWLAVDDGRTLVAWFVCLAGLTALGLIDDLSHVRPRYRLLVEAALGGGFAIVVFDADGVGATIAAALAGAIIVPVMANATNLVDNADGLAGSLSLTTALTVAAAAVAAGMRGSEIPLSLAIAGACGGFLLHNLPPARVFMGDAGSLMLGFALSSAGMLLVHDAMVHPTAGATAAALAIPLACFVQLGDVALVSVTRVRRGVSPFSGGTDHTSHRLVRAGFGPWGMLGLLTLAAAGCGGLAVLLTGLAPGGIVEIAVVTLAGCVVLALEGLVAWWLPYPETGGGDEQAAPAWEARPMSSDPR
jgi:UDP-GlcNAc:undecaprenyl-phosphate/decaprenyl-phosphate GlcNAc-1-phosphate transferase